jgi:hypothetical protein
LSPADWWANTTRTASGSWAPFKLSWIFRIMPFEFKICSQKIRYHIVLNIWVSSAGVVCTKWRWGNMQLPILSLQMPMHWKSSVLLLVIWYNCNLSNNELS